MILKQINGSVLSYKPRRMPYNYGTLGSKCNRKWLSLAAYITFLITSFLSSSSLIKMEYKNKPRAPGNTHHSSQAFQDRDGNPERS